MSNATERAHLIKCEQYHTTKYGGSRWIFYQKKDQRAVSSVVSSVVQQLKFTDKCMLRIQTHMSQSQRQRHGMSYDQATPTDLGKFTQQQQNSTLVTLRTEQRNAWVPRMPT